MNHDPSKSNQPDIQILGEKNQRPLTEADGEDIIMAELVEATPIPATSAVSSSNLSEPQMKRQNLGRFIQALLSPETLNSLMWIGCGFLVVGLVIGLRTVGVFNNATVAAVALGGINLAALGMGMSVEKWTRFRWAGNAISFLSCLVMPLNLWFYHSQGLMTLDNGGHLWVPALMMTAIFAGVARLLKDAKFIYAFVGGITMSGLLFLADQWVQRFFEFGWPALLLAVIGVGCLQLEQWFTRDEESPFSRKRFGRAFFISGHFALAGALTLKATELLASLADRGLIEATRPVVVLLSDQILGLIVGMLGVYGYVYSAVVCRDGRFNAASLFSFVLSLAQVVNLLGITITVPYVLILIAAVSMLGHWLASRLRIPVESESHDKKTMFGHALPTFATYVAWMVGVGGGIANAVDSQILDVPFLVSQMVTSLSFLAGMCFTANHSSIREKYQFNLVGFVASIVTCVATVVWMIGLQWLGYLLVPLMAIPFGMQMAKGRHSHVGNATSLEYISQAIAAALLVASVAPIFFVAQVTTMSMVWMAVFFALNSLFFVRAKGVFAKTLGTVSLAACVAQVQFMFGLGDYFLLLTLAGIGFVLIVAGRFTVGAEANNTTLTMGNINLSLASVGAILLATSRSLSGEISSSLVVVGLIHTCISLLASQFQKDANVRSFFVGICSLQFLGTLGMFSVLSEMAFIQKLETITTLGGLGFLAAGLGLRWREYGVEERTTISLSLGSVFSMLPLILGLLAYRFGGFEPTESWALIHNLGVKSAFLGK